jgi:hypothetical protein
LQSFGNILIPPGSGELASGLHGEGRMAEPEEIVIFWTDDIKKKLPLVNKRYWLPPGLLMRLLIRYVYWQPFIGQNGVCHWLMNWLRWVQMLL